MLRFNVLNLVGFITEVTLDNDLIISSFVRLKCLAVPWHYCESKCTEWLKNHNCVVAFSQLFPE